MNQDDFKKSLVVNKLPENVNALLQSLWYDAKGNWEKSHDIISTLDTKDAALVHAYLHRKEGDQWNADYWYRMAGAKRKDISLEEEWDELVNRFID